MRPRISIRAHSYVRSVGCLVGCGYGGCWSVVVDDVVDIVVVVVRSVGRRRFCQYVRCSV